MSASQVPVGGTGVLEVKNLVKDFTVRSGWKRSKLRAVNEVSFTLEPGKTIALVGESGSGKSTVARMIAQLETPTTGEIHLDGRAIARHGDALARYRHAVQMVFQDRSPRSTRTTRWGTTWSVR